MNTLATLLPGFDGTELPPWLADRLRAGLAGVCLFGPNIVDEDQLRTLTGAIRAAHPRALIAVDEEGGEVTRLHAAVGSPDPGNALLGRLDDLALTRRSAEQIGWRLRAVGIDLDLAPSVDINSCEENPIIGVRSFGGDPDAVGRHGAAFIAGLQATGVAATAKHFPGHGDTRTDSHLTLPVVDRSPAELADRELVPFVAAVEAGVEVVMTSHLMVPQLDPDRPATMSPSILLDLLRGELGFTGVIVSDALDMAGARRGGGAGPTAVRALAGGCDLLCLGTRTTDAEVTEIEEAVAAALASGELDPRRVDDAAARVRALAARPTDASEPVGASEPDWSDEQIIAGFDIGPIAARWRVDVGTAYAVVRLATEATIAAGPTPWDPFPDVAERVPGPDEAVVVLGRDLHRHPEARDRIDRLRADHHHVLVVDLGWPSADRRYADLATFGSSAVIRRALRHYLSG